MLLNDLSNQEQLKLTELVRMKRIASGLLVLMIVIFIVSNVILGYTGLPGSSGEVRAIAWEAHIGGFLAGFVLFPLFNGLGRQSGRGRS